MGAKIKKVIEKTAADIAGIMPGETVVSINGERILDVLDYQFYAYDAKLKIVLADDSGKERVVDISKKDGEDLGLEFETYLMSDIKRCANKCVFCFIDQMPKGMRETLYVKDDDARMSFLMGNYISLTNLTKRDIDRIIKMRISPINISVQTTNPELRNFMLGNPRAGASLGIMKTFAENRIQMNCQVVVCPQLNDGEELMKTLTDLMEMFPAVNSVSVVPVGITRHREGLLKLVPVGRREAREILKIADMFGNMCFDRFGYRMIYCADELYLKAGMEIPYEEYYDDYPQIENGVGMLRSFCCEFMDELENISEKEEIEPFTIATGKAAEGFMASLLDELKEKCGFSDYQIYGIPNLFFGESVDVAGLITGQDIIKHLKDKPLSQRLLIPESMLRHGEDRFLDDLTIPDIEKALHVKVIANKNDGKQFLQSILSKS